MLLDTVLISRLYLNFKYKCPILVSLPRQQLVQFNISVTNRNRMRYDGLLRRYCAEWFILAQSKQGTKVRYEWFLCCKWRFEFSVPSQVFVPDLWRALAEPALIPEGGCRFEHGR